MVEDLNCSGSSRSLAVLIYKTRFEDGCNAKKKREGKTKRNEPGRRVIRVKGK